MLVLDILWREERAVDVVSMYSILLRLGHALGLEVRHRVVLRKQVTDDVV